MDRRSLAELHYLTSVQNLASICEHGVLSHHLAAKLPHVDLSNPQIQDSRSGKYVAYAGQARARKLHSYANLFLHGRNSMLKDLCYRCGHETIAVVRIRADVLDLPGVVIADQNAASKYARFFSSRRASRFSTSDSCSPEIGEIPPSIRSTTGGGSSAEALVPDRVEPERISGAYVSCEGAREQCQALGAPIAVTVDSDLFFQP